MIPWGTRVAVFSIDRTPFIMNMWKLAICIRRSAREPLIGVETQVTCLYTVSVAELAPRRDRFDFFFAHLRANHSRAENHSTNLLLLRAYPPGISATRALLHIIATALLHCCWIWNRLRVCRWKKHTQETHGRLNAIQRSIRDVL